MMFHCLKDWPVHFSNHLEKASNPDISIIIAFRGTGRLPQLQCCLASLRAQQDCMIEIILVEQSWERLLGEEDMAGVKYIHARSTSVDMPFNKSWAMNVGARHALAETLVFHDGDIVAPKAYASSVNALLSRGYEVARVPRLVFYPDRAQFETLQASHALERISSVSEVRENCRGISLVMKKKSYWEIGGHDESFYGWGGEDDEILQRAETLNVFPGGFIPFIHLWHSAQLEKHSGMKEREAWSLKRMREPVPDRIRKLRLLDSGSIDSPACPNPLEDRAV